MLSTTVPEQSISRWSSTLDELPGKNNRSKKRGKDPLLTSDFKRGVSNYANWGSLCNIAAGASLWPLTVCKPKLGYMWTTRGNYLYRDISAGVAKGVVWDQRLLGYSSTDLQSEQPGKLQQNSLSRAAIQLFSQTPQNDTAFPSNKEKGQLSWHGTYFISGFGLEMQPPTELLIVNVPMMQSESCSVRAELSFVWMKGLNSKLMSHAHIRILYWLRASAMTSLQGNVLTVLRNPKLQRLAQARCPVTVFLKGWTQFC